MTGTSERYALTWTGKADAVAVAQSSFTGEPIPVTDGNLLIEGDNLDALRLLQPGYTGKVKLIYIDPPYNTGSDFIYQDDFKDHSAWLSMIYPRLALARHLLRPDGVICISIDDHEVHNLRMVMNELYGEEHFVACVANVNNPKGRSDGKYVATAHEYVLIYKKGEATLYGWAPEDKVLRRYRKVDEQGRRYREIDLRKTGTFDRREDRPNLFYYFLWNPEAQHLDLTRSEDVPDGYVQIAPLRDDGSHGRWRWEMSTARERADRLIPRLMPHRKVWTVSEKDLLLEDERIKPTTAWTSPEFNSERGPEDMVALGFDKGVFPHPKPVGMLKRILEFATSAHGDDLVLDFFAGSNVTAQAVLEQNAADGGRRRFICAQLPQALPEHSVARRHGFTTIADIGRARVDRVIGRLNQSGPPGANEDRSYQLLKLT